MIFTAMIWTNRPKPIHPARGFSLVELVAVIALLAIFASLAGISVRGHIANARLELALESIEALDGRIRDEALRRQSPDELRINVDRGKVYQSGAGRKLPSSRTVALGDTVQIDRIRIAKRESRHGELRVLVSLHGQSDSYALRLSTSTGRKVWLVVLGATGQCLRIEEEKDVASLLSPFAP